MALNTEGDTKDGGGGSKSIEILQKAIEQLTESSNRKSVKRIGTQTENLIAPTADPILDENQILTNLISQLQALKEDGMKKQCESSREENEEENEVSPLAEEIVKGVREVRRQNTVTHWLLSGLIAVTLVWQISEGLVIMKLQDGVKHPFRSLCSWLGAKIRPAPAASTNTAIGHETDKEVSLSLLPSSLKDTLVESAYRPLKLTNEPYNTDFELPQIKLPGFKAD